MKKQSQKARKSEAGEEVKENTPITLSSLRASTSKKIGNLLNFFNTAKRQFVFAVEQARVTGMLLGKFLATSSLADNRAVTMVGYSLGGVVSFNCMRTLKREYEHKNSKAGLILNDMNIWAGAYVIDVTKQKSEIKEKSMFCTVVNGNLNNLYSKKDTVLKYMFT